ncbi:MAG TPA: type II toxin-antitoxin system prevent-host-death family antitoxin [Chloroflexota bacterium]|nr:type II toxin-antitoxin system prevent-host-death family antitoxin [Chloroflexota bacterium]
MATEIGIRELKNQASKIVRAVREEAAEYIITVNGEPVAVLRP